MRFSLAARGVTCVRLGLAGTLLIHGLVAYATAATQPLVLDTQRGIQDGKSGLLLQTAPLSSEPIVEPAKMRAPAEQTPGTSIPLFVAPYINVPGWGTPPAGQAKPVPQPQPRQP